MGYREAVADAARGQRVQSGGWIRANCPACRERVFKNDSKKCLAIKADSGWYSCWRCGIKGFLKGHEPRQYEEAEAPETGQPDGFVPLYQEPWASASSLATARAYLAERARRELWEPAHLGACNEGKYFGRIVVPVLGDEREWLGWVGRDWTGTAPRKYTYPPGMHRGEMFYNHEALLVPSDEPVMIVESVFDALAHWPNAVAVMGKPSNWQMEALINCPRPVAIVLDGDAVSECWSTAMRLRLSGQRAGAVLLDPMQDPDEVPSEELMERCRTSLIT